MTRFLYAARLGRLPLVQQLLANGTADINEVGPQGHTALTEAVQNGNTLTAEWLLVNGAKIKEVDSRTFHTLLQTHWTNYTVEWMRAEGYADITIDGCTIWNRILASIRDWKPMSLKNRTLKETELPSMMIKFITLLAEPPADFVEILRSPSLRRQAKAAQAEQQRERQLRQSPVVDEVDLGQYIVELVELALVGQQLRARLPKYLKKQRTMVVEHCPLPAVLQLLVADYVPEPTLADIWEFRLPIVVRQQKRAREADEAVAQNRIQPVFARTRL
jgi:hypothetical protein